MQGNRIVFGGFSFWMLVMAVLALLGLAAFVYLTTRFHRFSFVERLGQKRRLLSWLLALALAALPAAFLLINTTTMIVVELHLVAAFLLCGLLGLLADKLLGLKVPYDVRGCAAIALCAVYLGLGFFMAHHVFETHYTLTTAKALPRDVRIVEIADSHLGITLDGADFAREMARIQKLEPDAVVLVGDFVDDASEASDMRAACSALGNLETTYGVFYAYGNHDEGYRHGRDFTAEELRQELVKNGVIILEDTRVQLDEGLSLIGRRDRSDRTRADMSLLTAGPSSSEYCIVLDHQPNDYAAEAAAGADLVLSGHTHGGHVFPAGQIGLLLGANDALYGLQHRGDTAFIVTSGLSGWAIPIKTGTRSEFVVIDIQSTAA